jgi:hypothetical protein
MRCRLEPSAHAAIIAKVNATIARSGGLLAAEIIMAASLEG